MNLTEKHISQRMISCSSACGNHHLWFDSLGFFHGFVLFSSLLFPKKPSCYARMICCQKASSISMVPPSAGACHEMGWIRAGIANRKIHLPTTCSHCSLLMRICSHNLLLFEDFPPSLLIWKGSRTARGVNSQHWVISLRMVSAQERSNNHDTTCI